MAVKARPWTAADREIARLLTENKEARKWSFRTIEEKSGINYVRVRDISNAVHGTPTVSEFLAICETFDLDPAATLRRIVARAAAIENTPQETDDQDMPLPADEIMRLAANRDDNRDAEAETPRD